MCDKDEFNEGVFGNNDDPDARFVELRPCEHVIEVSAMDALMDECCNGLEMMGIQLKRYSTPLTYSIQTPRSPN